MTPDKGVEAFYQHMLKSTPVLDEFERASLKLKVKELFTQHHQDLMSEERQFLERIKLEIDVAVCDCGDSWEDSDLSDLVNERLQA